MMHVRSVRTYLSAYIADLKKPDPTVQGKLGKKRKRIQGKAKNSEEVKKRRPSGDDCGTDGDESDDDSERRKDKMSDETKDLKNIDENEEDSDEEANNNQLVMNQPKSKIVSDELFLENGEIKKMILGRDASGDSDEVNMEALKMGIDNRLVAVLDVSRRLDKNRQNAMARDYGRTWQRISEFSSSYLLLFKRLYVRLFESIYYQDPLVFEFLITSSL
ncbi:hypothetical protein QAD02_008257 [Eretmocerus hayati]|uniref:Uncharacterized protein n=1 Tax=Eretmocerus hayati TaxID=131215 RepID=A0ACC2N5X3_9HYME|nr:hypothetical protein QAD02_008257 [Eretmocerus hayati]